MWEQYYYELFGRKTFKTDFGFICYQIEKDVCHIVDLYVLPEKRKSLEASKLINSVVEIAKSLGCKFLYGSVHLGSKGSEWAILNNIKFGMNPVEANNNRIYFSKEI